MGTRRAEVYHTRSRYRRTGVQDIVTRCADASDGGGIDRSCVEPKCSAPVSSTAVATAAGRVRDAEMGEREDERAQWARNQGKMA